MLECTGLPVDRFRKAVEKFGFAPSCNHLLDRSVSWFILRAIWPHATRTVPAGRIDMRAVAPHIRYKEQRHAGPHHQERQASGYLGWRTAAGSIAADRRGQDRRSRRGRARAWQRRRCRGSRRRRQDHDARPDRCPRASLAHHVGPRRHGAPTGVLGRDRNQVHPRSHAASRLHDRPRCRRPGCRHRQRHRARADQGAQGVSFRTRAQPDRRPWRPRARQ